MTPKKRLAVLPEILPAPQQAAPATSSVRDRTLARLRVLAAIGVGVATACGGKAAGDGSGGGGGGGHDGGLPNDGGPGEEDAYGVVDPLPPPACFPVNDPPKATASYVVMDGGADDGGPDAGAGRLVQVDLSWSLTNVVLGTFSSADGVELVDSASTTSGATLVVRVPSQAGSARARIRISCSTGPSTLALDFELEDDDVVVEAREERF